MLSMDDHQWSEDKALITTLTKAGKMENDMVKTRLPIQRNLCEALIFETERYYDGRQPYLEIMFKTIFLFGYLWNDEELGN